MTTVCEERLGFLINSLTEVDRFPPVVTWADIEKSRQLFH
jgi:hypothetical protein